ncbi:MAG: response regulator [Verrucomicrobiaceae bacterium]|nr:response regulator [Verrucomicrobiaceae bacterium]
MSDTPDAAKKKILLIDDEPFITNLMALNLEDTGRFEVREQNDSLQALDTIMDFVPDLIVLDVMMPDLDGADIIYRLKNDARLKHIAVVFHTATVREAELSAHGGIISGFPFLPKPATTEQMIAFIEKHLPK